jgi:hypothetical protein
MDPRKQKQMVSQLFENTAKSQEELDKMTTEEKREYLRGRLKQRMFFNGVSRQSMHQKKKIQEKIEDTTKQTENQEVQNEPLSKTAEKNRKKREKKRAAMLAARAAEEALNKSVEEDDNENEDIVIVKRESESDYESDNN